LIISGNDLDTLDEYKITKLIQDIFHKWFLGYNYKFEGPKFDEIGNKLYKCISTARNDAKNRQK
jgi:hypothetical protein